MTPAALSALSLGYLFPAKERHVLQVHSAFQHALNLRSEEGTHLTLLCAKKYQNLPDAARVMLPEQWDWRRETAGCGPVRLTHGVVIAQRFRIDLNRATVWQPQLRRASRDPKTGLWPQRHYKTLDAQLLLFCLEHKVGSALQWQGNILHQGLRPQESPKQLEDQVPRLIGYGKGLTPDGDDYLLGYLAALWLWKLPPMLAAHYARLQQAIERQLPHTTDISQHYLRGALRGHFSQLICELLKQLNADAPTTTVIACAEQVMQFGATSGVDCLAGLLHGMRTLNAHH
ncbi:hypothetical protein C3432_26695 [Citrobacter amalonaticus]|uniref:DUF2877 domain-containing protein n=1 Tax=Citrobacter amalonaticus TaxID=35703 RepID=A0A2S4RQZ2_CITAM|nr:DUF2877 domain-containing protein [Citrobacter amalonaticus]POT54600.1 hypothetical protein C3432_26695 [Citrobacter amalonaticus]POT69545.1 hypothetical protein C3436_26300 [Citrobacter amalonaticus]POU60356.1 hypothetical protein C3430_25220 [Citrobacter amalonaticus]POV02651.1 hypothetical protein C3424_25400 [Citrobacter amalonaticus]